MMRMAVVAFLHDDEQTARLDATIVSIPPWHVDFVVQRCCYYYFRRIAWTEYAIAISIRPHNQPRSIGNARDTIGKYFFALKTFIKSIEAPVTDRDLLEEENILDAGCIQEKMIGL